MIKFNNNQDIVSIECITSTLPTEQSIAEADSSVKSKSDTYQNEGDVNALLVEDKQYPQRTTSLWKVVHASLYSLGAVLFIAGSFMFFPGIDNGTLGAALFIIGSAKFTYGDAMEWWMNNRVGCVCYKEYEISYEKQLGENFEPADTCLGKYQRAANGINYFISMFGSMLYLIGSIYFVPSMNTLRAASILFILGSFLVFLSQLWKLWRLGSRINSTEATVINYTEPTRYNSFRLSAFHDNWLNFWVKASSGLGGAAYLIGSIYFLPDVDTTDRITDIAAFWFVLGSVFYGIAALCLVLEYYYAINNNKALTASKIVNNNRGKQKYQVVVNTSNVLHQVNRENYTIISA